MGLELNVSLLEDRADGLNVFCMNCVMHTLICYEIGDHDYTVVVSVGMLGVFRSSL